MAASETLIPYLLLLAFVFLLFLFFSSGSRHRWRSSVRKDEIHRIEATIALPPPSEVEAVDGGGEGRATGKDGEQRRRRKKSGRKRKQEGVAGESDGGKDGGSVEIGADKKKGAGGKKDGDDERIYPFSSFASATQRKIKLQYDQLLKSNQAKTLTVAQVGEFVNCLVEAKDELQQKSNIIKRSFKIKKALLFKADRSSFGRICQQLYKLEAEHTRLEEDVAVYNLLQEQIKLSPAYKRMVEISASMEISNNLDQQMEFSDISFEELLAQEKKDSFWLKNGKLRSCSN